MLPTLRLMRSFNRRGADRVAAMRREADTSAASMAPWVAAIALWEEGEIDDAHRLAEAYLANEPDDFRMLVICLDWNIRKQDAEQTLSYARRVAAAEQPLQRIRWVHSVLRVVFLPFRWLGLAGIDGVVQDRSTMILWAQWAREHVREHEDASLSR